MVQIKIPMLTTLSLLSATIGCSAATITNSLLLSSIADQLSLPASTWSANGTHTAKGFTSQSADTPSVEGLKQDCDNINLNKKLAVDFRSDVLGDGVTGFFYKCEKVSSDTNKYWFTISAGDKAQIDQLCDLDTTYPIVFDQQHNTWFIDEPFDSLPTRLSSISNTTLGSLMSPSTVRDGPTLRTSSERTRCIVLGPKKQSMKLA